MKNTVHSLKSTTGLPAPWRPTMPALTAAFLAGATSLSVFPALAQPDLKKGGMASEKKDKTPPQALENNPAVTKMGVLRGGGAVSFSEQRVRLALQDQGITDENTQTAVVAHLNRLDEARKAIAEKQSALRANIKPNAAMADAQFNVLLNDYLAAVEDYKIVREKSEQQLDEKIHYAKTPRLHATLLVLGYIGEAPAANSGDFGGAGIDILNTFGKANNLPMIMHWATPPEGAQIWNFQGNINGQPFAFDQNGAVPPEILKANPNVVPAQPFVFRTPLMPDARNFQAPAPNNADVAVIKQWRAFGNGRNGLTVTPNAVPNPFTIIPANPAGNVLQYNTLRRDLDAQMKELQAQLERLKAEQATVAQAAKKEKEPAKDEKVP